jgi:hypothetical protein
MRKTGKISVLFIQGMFVGPSMRVAPTLSSGQVVLDCRDTRQRCIFRKDGWLLTMVLDISS